MIMIMYISVPVPFVRFSSVHERIYALHDSSRIIDLREAVDTPYMTCDKLIARVPLDDNKKGNLASNLYF